MHPIIKKHWLCFILLTALGMGCQSSNYEPSNNKDFTEQESDGVVPSVTLADTISPTLNASERKFIRTADVKFKTKDVSRTTQEVENLTRKYNGFVTHTHLTSSVINTTTIPISADSLLERKEYIMENTMTIRVPNHQLDTLLYEINNSADFVDFRIVKADDVHLQLLENSLKIKRAAQTEKRYTKAIDEQSKKLPENMSAEEALFALQNQADSHTLSNLTYLDKINFSTVSLNFYQPSTFKYDKLINHTNIKAFEPSLIQRISEAFAAGWSIFEEVLIFIVRIWALLLIGIAGFWLYRRLWIRTAEKF
jgi:hypothetical protein